MERYAIDVVLAHKTCGKRKWLGGRKCKECHCGTPSVRGGMFKEIVPQLDSNELWDYDILTNEY